MKKTKQTDEWTPATSVGWYDPGQLIQTGIKVTSSSLFAENADGRLVQPLFDPEAKVFDEAQGPTGARQSLTLDYIADTGDAFDPTYAVLYYATSALRIDEDHWLAPGQIMLLGGDQVYPTASDAAYDRKLVRPLRMASAQVSSAARPSLYAIPGNHDWYDNLVAFRRLFIAEHRIGGFEAKQKRSYFVLKLPHGWWLFAPDVQLGSELDVIQYEYLKGCAAQLPADARVILCTAEPHWVYDNERAQSDSEEPQRSRLLIELERAIDGSSGRIRCVLAGDLHHYRRHTGRVGNKLRDVQLITAGGGGAFLHPTHSWRDGGEPRYPGRAGYTLHKAYPDAATSRRLTRRLLIGFIYDNPNFLAASAVLYGLMALQIILGARLRCLLEPQRCAEVAVDAAASPGVVILAALIFAGFLAFTDTSSRSYRFVAGSLHGLAHATLAIAIPLLTLYCFGAAAVGAAVAGGLSLSSVALHLGQVCLTLLADTVLGALSGGVVMGVYLFVSLNWFGRHRNEAFSALRSPRYKNFLRIVINSGGARIYAFGIDNPASAWRPAPEQAVDDEPAEGEERSLPAVRLEPASATPAPTLIEAVLLE